MKFRQQQELKQIQKLSPLQMQVIKLIELNTVELEDRIKQEIEDNPALDTSDFELDGQGEDLSLDRESDETSEDISFGDYLNEDDVPDFQMRDSLRREQPDFIGSTFSNTISLYDFLVEQINLRELNPIDKEIAIYITGNLDENGYLQSNFQSISNDLLFQQNIDVSDGKLKEILCIIQDLEPAGVGARDLRECLLLQLNRISMSDAQQMALKIIENYFDEFSKKHYDKITRALQISTEELRDAMEVILSLNPKPGNIWGDPIEMAMNDITPDFIVETYNGEISMYLNNKNIPDLKINNTFAEMLQGYSQNKESMSSDKKQAMLFMKQKVDSAKWFIDSIKQRQNTLKKTMEAIIKFQQEFFLTEDEATLKPMILKDIANETSLDISTVSRVSNSKYVQTNGGIYPLKFFFSEAMQTDEGEDISSREIKVALKEIIEKEDQSKPITDDKITKMLNEMGYIIARRTVAKYREQLNLPVARLRRKI